MATVETMSATEFKAKCLDILGRVNRGEVEKSPSPSAVSWLPSLPGQLHGDPGDRMMVATARVLGVPVVRRDRTLLAYAAQGYVEAVAC